MTGRDRTHGNNRWPISRPGRSEVKGQEAELVYLGNVRIEGYDRPLGGTTATPHGKTAKRDTVFGEPRRLRAFGWGILEASRNRDPW